MWLYPCVLQVFFYHFYEIPIKDLILDMYYNFAQLNFFPSYPYLILYNFHIYIHTHTYIYMAQGEYSTQRKQHSSHYWSISSLVCSWNNLSYSPHLHSCVDMQLIVQLLTCPHVIIIYRFCSVDLFCTPNILSSLRNTWRCSCVSFSSYKSTLRKLKRTRKCKQHFPVFVGSC